MNGFAATFIHLVIRITREVVILIAIIALAVVIGSAIGFLFL